ncbi:MAG TPA: efflux RND transporter periplasmic adaptor subunit [Gammaproteobacteria bacterium]|nr:efflux RND transporter periplasmic adaptor subunit [Gammaproteobacteria bacterium]
MNRRFLLLLLPGIAIPAAVAFDWFNFKESADNGLVVSGTLEARNIDVGSKIGGRITQVLAHEGDHMTAGQLLVVFDDAELKARVDQAQGHLDSAHANLEKLEHGSRPEDIAEALAATSKGANDRGYLIEAIAQARADRERAAADAIDAEQSFRRVRDLVRTGALPAQSQDDAQAKLDTTKAALRAADYAVAGAEGRLRAAQAVSERTERGFRQEDIDAARADAAQAQGELEEAQARWAEHEVRAPTAAVVEVLDRRPGDLLPPNAIVAKLLEADQLYVVVYVPETQIGLVHVGQNARVSVDAYPGEIFSAKVEQIRQQAEFLPRNVQTREERVHQVIGVKLRVDNPRDRLRAGVSAEVRFAGETDNAGNTR